MDKKVGLISVFLILSYGTTFSQTDRLLFENYKLGCSGRTFSFSLPPSFKQDSDNYTEGIFYSFRSPDSSVLVIHCGFNNRIPLLHDKKYKLSGTTDTGRHGTIKWTSYFWREENLRKGLNIYYTNIKQADKELFDNILNDIIKSVEK